MKKYNFKIQNLSKKADFKIKSKLYYLNFKKNLKQTFSVWFSRVFVPVSVFAIMLLWIFNLTNIFDPSSEIKQTAENTRTKSLVQNKVYSSKEYIEISKERVYKKKLSFYTKLAIIRSIKAKSLNK